MPIIELTTFIHAPIGQCFDLARSIDMHKLSTGGTDEEAIAGVTSGLIGKGEYVTWRARHFGVAQTLTSKITALEYPHYFRDEMTKGVFRILEHDHLFEEFADKTVMKDKFYFESPGWIIGTLFNKIILTSYLRDLLVERNRMIKEVAESERWRTILNV
jgi:ligand-binding SRPBCC domain-containing protein